MVITSGRIKIANVSPEGREVILNFLRAGDVSGEIAVLDEGDRTADAIALEPTEALVISSRDLLPILKAHPEALLAITRLLCEKLRAASAIVEDNTLEMRSRAAKGLLRLAQRHGKAGDDGILVDLVLSQQDLGNYLGISRENVSRQLRQLRFANVIRADEGHIIITDKSGLSEIAEDVGN
jgi:CRP-like cAMP-binding protein